MVRSLVQPDPVPGSGRFACPEFTIEGDFYQAYLWLKQRYDRPTEPSKSGPIKPISSEELKIEQNQATANMLNTLPESEFTA